MEMNPFTLDHEGSPFPLDMRGELDDTAAFKSAKKWGAVEFPLPFGRTMTAAEEYVHSLDGNTGRTLAETSLVVNICNVSVASCGNWRSYKCCLNGGKKILTLHIMEAQLKPDFGLQV